MKIAAQGALITGASRGLGRALAEALAAKGARVAMVAREPGPLGDAVATIRARGGIAHAIAADVGDKTAVHPYPRWGAYAVSKAAQDHLGRVLAAELEGTGVRVLSIDPGEMDTRMHRDAIPDADPATLQQPAQVAARIVAMIEDDARAPSGARLVAPAWVS